jgi:hypothetical protein
MEELDQKLTAWTMTLHAAAEGRETKPELAIGDLSDLIELE